MALKAHGVTSSSNPSSADVSKSNKGSTLPFFIKQLEYVISEEEKAIAFKTNLLRWVNCIFY